MAVERINWIDWAKCIAITMVIFGHLPQAPDSFIKYYICVFHMPFFFFISGYLTKIRKEAKEEISKYKRSIIIPYFLYNAIFYPYWFFRLYVDNSGNITPYDYIVKPLIGIFYLQKNTYFSSSVNGVTWFILALLVMRIIAHLCNRTNHSIRNLTIVALLSIPLFAINLHEQYVEGLFADGLLKCFSFFILGFITRQFHVLDKVNPKKDFLYSLILICISLTLCQIEFTDTSNFSKSLITFYGISFTAIYGTIYLCKSLNIYSLQFVTTISIGTLMIMGLHWMFLGTINYILEHILPIDGAICYPTFVAILLAIAIDIAIYPLIYLAKRYWPILLGK